MFDGVTGFFVFSHFAFFFFSFFCSANSLSITLSSRSLICPLFLPTCHSFYQAWFSFHLLNPLSLQCYCYLSLISCTLFSSLVSILMIINLNSLSDMLLISVSHRSLTIALSCSFILDKFLCLLILSRSLCLFLYVRKTNHVSSLWGQWSYEDSSMHFHVVSPVSQGLVLPGASPMRAVCSAVLSWLLYPSGQSSAEALFACCGQCFVPDLNVVHFN